MRTVLVISLALALLAPAAWAQTTPQTIPALTELYACAGMTDPAARLTCYDEATTRLRQAESTGQVAVVDRQRAQELERESFGLQLPNLTRLLGGGQDRVENIETTVVRVGDRGQGYHSFELGNGQTWVQIEAQSVRNIRVGDTIRVERASLGSYRLLGSRGGAGHRVRREAN